MNASRKRIRYDANGCGGDFSHVHERFDTWKRESLVYRPERRMFGGKDEVRVLNDTVHDGPARTVDDAAYATYTHRDASQQQLALGRLADGFSRMMSKRNPAALAGDYHVERF
ncbi:hypothetical protein [Burkholderia sp. LMG 32019]|uniref:hypothetical protein n=1 Tax=Burkholderia sp. LMG 32019 TaxID=3158173 RepID=UPI003C307537